MTTPVTPVPDASQPLPDPSDLGTWPARMAEMHRWMRQDLRNGMNDLADATYANALVAESVANFRGAWSGLSGGLTVPATCSHSGRIWLLLQTVGDVAAEQPGVSVAWLDVTPVRPDQVVRLVGGAARLPSWTTAGRPATPGVGDIGLNTDLQKKETWSGTHWVQDGVVESPFIATASGSSHEVSGVPPWAKRVTAHLVEVSMTGTQYLLARVGSGSLLAAGYTGTTIDVSGGVETTSAAGMPMRSASSANKISGTIELVKVPGSFTYKMSALLRRTDTSGGALISHAIVALPAVLDRFGLVRQGTDAFDGGGFFVTWEG